MKRYFLMLPKLDPDVEDVLVEACEHVFRINFSTSVIYFFVCQNMNVETKKALITDPYEMVLMDITNAQDFFIKLANQEECDMLEDLLHIIQKENVTEIDDVLDKISKYGSSSLTIEDLKILKA